jgi:hypothetical protein
VTGAYYDLKSDAVDLDVYVGQRVTVTGTPLASPAIGGAGAERCPDLDVTRVEPLDGAGGSTPPPGGTTPPAGGSATGVRVLPATGGATLVLLGAGALRVLPATGGATLVLLGAGALLMAAGLLVRRATR